MSVILPNPWAVTLVYVVGLISPEAVTSDTRFSWFATLAVCTVTTPLFAWFTLNRTIPPSTTTAPAPIATLCHVFIRFPFDLPLRPRTSKPPPLTLLHAIQKRSIRGAQMSVQLPLPYIRPFGSKCFAGGLLHFRGSGFKAGDLLEPVSPPASAAPSVEVSPAPDDILCSKHPKGKNSCPATAGPSLTTDPLSLTQKKSNGQPETGIPCKKDRKSTRLNSSHGSIS